MGSTNVSSNVMDKKVNYSRRPSAGLGFRLDDKVG